MPGACIAFAASPPWASTRAASCSKTSRPERSPRSQWTTSYVSCDKARGQKEPPKPTVTARSDKSESRDHPETRSLLDSAERRPANGKLAGPGERLSIARARASPGCRPDRTSAPASCEVDADAVRAAHGKRLSFKRESCRRPATSQGRSAVGRSE